jgi:uncharacterized membrane protein
VAYRSVMATSFSGSGAHSHAHGPGPVVSRRTRRLVAAILLPLAGATVLAVILLWPPPAPQERVVAKSTGEHMSATVTAVTEQACPPAEAGAKQPDGRPRRCGEARVTITEGSAKGQTVTIALPQGAAAPLHVGDDIAVDSVPDATSGKPVYSYLDHHRTTPMIWLVGLTVAAILAFGRWRGLTSLAGLAFSFAVLVLFVIPAILDGSPPLLIAVVGSAAIMLGALYLTHGISVHISVAVAGTLASLVLTGLLGAWFTASMHMTGVGSDDTSYLSSTRSAIDLRGLLLAGIVIGALGVLDDVTVTQAVTVAELAAARPTSRRDLYRAATRIGRAHVGSAVNTIVLAYAGASLPLLLLVAVSSQPFGDTLDSEFLAQEVLRAAVGTIGLVASVPITTALAVLVARFDRGRVPVARRPARHAAETG